MRGAQAPTQVARGYPVITFLEGGAGDGVRRSGERWCPSSHFSPSRPAAGEPQALEESRFI